MHDIVFFLFLEKKDQCWHNLEVEMKLEEKIREKVI